jgi:hypothetical protein
LPDEENPMTTSVMIASPYNAVHGLVVQIQKADGTVVGTFKVAPRETAETLHIDGDTRVVIAQDDDSMPGPAAPKSK